MVAAGEEGVGEWVEQEAGLEKGRLAFDGRERGSAGCSAEGGEVFRGGAGEGGGGGEVREGGRGRVKKVFEGMIRA